MIFNIINNLGYTTKLDSYYYDNVRCTTILILKIRYKRAVSHVPINNILQDKQALSKMHPIDLCIIGVLANNASIQSEDNINNMVTVTDDFLMMKIQQTLEVIRRDYTGIDETVTLKLTTMNKEITISTIELYNNKKLINALKYHDAIALGYSINDPDDFLKENAVRTDNNYSTNLCVINGLFFGILLLSTLLFGREISFEFLEKKHLIKGEILLLPLLFLLKNYTIENNNIKNEGMFFTSMILALTLFFLYYSFITKLPFPLDNSATEAFNALYYSITNNPPKYFICLISTIMVVNHTKDYINLKLKNYSSKIKDSLVSCFYISVFFLISSIFCLVMKLNNYSLTDYFYSLFLIIFTLPLFSAPRFLRKKK